jgi:hypothetical protein
VALDASNVPIPGKTYSYVSSDTSKLKINASTGDMTSVGVLPAPYIDIVKVTATETGSGIGGAINVVLLKRGTSPYSVTISGASPGLPAVDIFAYTYVPGASLLHVQGATGSGNPQTSSASGYFSQFPPLLARSFYTLKLSKTGYLDAYMSGTAPSASGTASYAFLYLFTQTGLQSTLPSPACGGVAWKPGLAGLYLTFDKSYVGQWKAYVGPSSGAQVVYAKPLTGSTPVFDCSQPYVDIASGSTKGGAMIAYNIDTSTSKQIWIIYKDGNKLIGSLLGLGPSSWSYGMPWVP